MQSVRPFRCFDARAIGVSLAVAGWLVVSAMARPWTDARIDVARVARARPGGVVRRADRRAGAFDRFREAHRGGLGDSARGVARLGSVPVASHVAVRCNRALSDPAA
jgi:hypothetical protein